MKPGDGGRLAGGPCVRSSALAAVAGALLLAATPGVAVEPLPWHLARTEQFSVYGELPPDQLSGLALHLQRLHDLLTRLAPDIAQEATQPMTLFAFADSASFAPFLPPNRNGSSVGAYLVAHELGAHAAFDASRSGGPRTVVIRQYVHYLLHQQLPWLPYWFKAGVAELYGTFETDARESRIGLPSPDHLFALRRLLDAWPDLDEILRQRGAHGPSTSPWAYESGCWALAHYLLIGDDDRPALARDFSLRVARGEPALAALHASFGPLADDIDAKVHAYVQQESFRYLRVPNGATRPIAIEVLELTPFERDAALAELSVRVASQRRDRALQLFDRALEANPDYAPALAGRGQLLQATGDLSGALAAFEHAIRIDGADFLLHYHYGNALLATLGNARPGDDAGRERLARARGELAKSAALNPGFAPAWSRLGFACGLEPTPSDDEVPALERALALQPGQLDVASNLVLAYARRGDRHGVEATLTTLRRLGADADRLDRAEEVRFQLDYREANLKMRDHQLDDAVGLLSRVAVESHDAELRQKAQAQRELVLKVIQHNRFVDLYGEVVDDLRRGDCAAAATALDRLREVARPGVQREIGGELQQRLIDPDAPCSPPAADG